MDYLADLTVKESCSILEQTTPTKNGGCVGIHTTNPLKYCNMNHELCKNDHCTNTRLHCLYWRLQIPQKKCWLQTLETGHDVPCEVLDKDDWFIKMFAPLPTNK